MQVKRAGRATAAAGAVLLSLALTSCALLEGPTPVTPERTPNVSANEPGATEESPEDPQLVAFTEALQTFADGTAAVQGESLVNTLVDAGFDKSAMQVTFDMTKTNLVADSLYVSVRLDDQCLIGQMVSETRELVTEMAPAVGPDQTVCIIGKTRSIDW